MALLSGICHPIIVTGLLTNSNTLSLKLPFSDINSNLWQIALNELSISYLNDVQDLKGITCNFVTDICFNENRQIINNEPILWQILLKGKKNDKTVLRFHKSWFYVTNVQEEIKLTFLSLQDGKILKTPIVAPCEVYASLLLQRVK